MYVELHVPLAVEKRAGPPFVTTDLREQSRATQDTCLTNNREDVGIDPDDVSQQCLVDSQHMHVAEHPMVGRPTRDTFGAPMRFDEPLRPRVQHACDG